MKMKKTLLVVLAVVLIASLTIGGTLAYFTWQSEEHENVFQVSGEGVEVEIPEDEDGNPTIEPGWDPDEDHPIEPGAAYAKDPQVTITGTECYVYFKVEEVNNTVNGLTVVQWAAREGWVDITDDVENAEEGCYYFAWNTTVKGADEGETDPTLYLFTDIGNVNANGSVLVNPELSNDDIADLYEQGDEVKLIITAYAVQASAGETAAAAFNAACGTGDITA